MSGFEIKDCVLLSLMSGMPPAFNLRELRDRIAACSQDVLYHHFCETTLVASFDYPDYRNDFAVWASKRLGDKVLAERLGIIPTSFPQFTGGFAGGRCWTSSMSDSANRPWFPGLGWDMSSIL